MTPLQPPPSLSPDDHAAIWAIKYGRVANVWASMWPECTAHLGLSLSACLFSPLALPSAALVTSAAFFCAAACRVRGRVRARVRG